MRLAASVPAAPDDLSNSDIRLKRSDPEGTSSKEPDCTALVIFRSGTKECDKRG